MPPRDAIAIRPSDAIAVAVCGVDDSAKQRLAAHLAEGRVRLVGVARDIGALRALLSDAPAETMVLLSRAEFDALVPSQSGAGEPAADDRSALTPRELEVLGALADGASNKMIARRLGISFHTVKFHVAAILDKLDADSRTEAVAAAARSGLVML